MRTLFNFLRMLTPPPVVNFYHWLVAEFGAHWYRHPSRQMVTIGVTGTTGKSTVVYLLARILEAAGYKTAATSSIEFKIQNKVRRNSYKMTMPGRMVLQKFLRQAVDEGCTHAVIEVTSEGILQHRHSGVDFDMAVFTNLSPEHIERHGNFEAYKAAKGELFKALSKRHKTSGGKPIQTMAVVNLADQNSGYFLQFPADKKIGYRFGANIQQVNDEITRIVAEDLKVNESGSTFRMHGTEIQTPLLGKFNAENAFAAATAAVALGVNITTIQKVVAAIRGIPGRMEEIIVEGAPKPFRVFVDYAHTPFALENVYQTVRTIGQAQGMGRLICVLGSAGGGRDKWKRPEMGKTAGRFCDNIIITNEDPYDEDPRKIMDEVIQGVHEFLKGASLQQFVEEILDRRQAIVKAVRLAQPKDLVMITGKGSESWMAVEGGKLIPWDDREIVRQALLGR